MNTSSALQANNMDRVVCQRASGSAPLWIDAWTILTMLKSINPLKYLRVDVISDVHVDDAQLLQLDVNDVTRSADEAQDGGRRGDGNNVII